MSYSKSRTVSNDRPDAAPNSCRLVFVFPAFDAALVGRCALILEPACAARLRQVNPHFLAIFISGEVVRQLLAGRAAIDIVLGQIDKIRFPKAACRLSSRGLRLG